MTYDAEVVGAGIMGCATADWLAMQTVSDHRPLVDGYESLIELGYQPLWLDRT